MRSNRVSSLNKLCIRWDTVSTNLIWTSFLLRVLHRRPGSAPRRLVRWCHREPRHQDQAPVGPIRERQGLRQVPVPSGLFGRHTHQKRPLVLQKPLPVSHTQLNTHRTPRPPVPRSVFLSHKTSLFPWVAKESLYGDSGSCGSSASPLPSFTAGKKQSTVSSFSRGVSVWLPADRHQSHGSFCLFVYFVEMSSLFCFVRVFNFRGFRFRYIPMFLRLDLLPSFPWLRIILPDVFKGNFELKFDWQIKKKYIKKTFISNWNSINVIIWFIYLFIKGAVCDWVGSPAP